MEWSLIVGLVGWMIWMNCIQIEVFIKVKFCMIILGTNG